MMATDNDWLVDLMVATAEMVCAYAAIGQIVAAGSGAATEAEYYA